MAGISLSKLLTRSTLMVSRLGLDDQSTLSQTISKGSVNQAKDLINTLQAESDGCQRQWAARAAWQAKYVKYKIDAAKAARAKPKTTVPASDYPGPIPGAPNADDCAPPSAFGFPASALPGPQAVAPTPAPTPTVRPTPTPTGSAKKKTPTPAAG